MSALPSRPINYLLLNGALVTIVGLLSGIGLLFEILDMVALWPIFIELENGFPGTENGWQLAHVAGLMNGMLMLLIGVVMIHISPTPVHQRWISRCMIYTGWGNTLFFHLGNFSSNRALALEATRVGEVDLIGTLGYVIGGSTIPLTIVAAILVARTIYINLGRDS